MHPNLHLHATYTYGFVMKKCHLKQIVHVFKFQSQLTTFDQKL